MMSRVDTRGDIRLEFVERGQSHDTESLVLHLGWLTKASGTARRAAAFHTYYIRHTDA